METARIGQPIVASALVGLLALGQALGAQAPSAGSGKGKGPVKVFLLAGQSNMEGHAELRTIDFLGEDTDPARAALLKKFKPDGKTLVTRDDVWIAKGAAYGNLGPGYGAGVSDKPGNKIGPEYGFGCFMGEALDQQVLLIKVSTGGTSLHQDWRPPSAGPLADVKPEDLGYMYKELVSYTHQTLKDLKKHFPDYDEKAGYEIAGFVWFQGYNDMFNEIGRKEYGKNLVCLIKDLRKEFNAPEMKVVVGVMGVNGPRNEGTANPKQDDVRNGQRFVNTVPEFKGNVKAIESAPLLHPKILELNCAGWLYKERDLKKTPITPEEQAMLARATSNLGYHYFGEGRFFILLGKALAETMQELMGTGK